MDELQEWLKATTDEIFLVNISINSKDLSTIMKSSSKCKRLIIQYSKIDASETLDFNIDSEYNISELSFQYSGDYDRSNWKLKRNELVSILKAINNCGLKNSLQKISLYNWNGYPSSLGEAQTVAADSSLDQSLIVFEKWNPTEG